MILTVIDSHILNLCLLGIRALNPCNALPGKDWQSAGVPRNRRDTVVINTEPSSGLAAMQTVRELDAVPSDADWKNAQRARSLAAQDASLINTEPSIVSARRDDVAAMESERSWKGFGGRTSSSDPLRVLGEPSSGDNSLRAVRDLDVVDPRMDWKLAGVAEAVRSRSGRPVVSEGGVAPPRDGVGDGERPRWRDPGVASTAEVIPPNNEPSTGLAVLKTRGLDRIGSDRDWKVAPNAKSLAAQDTGLINAEPAVHSVSSHDRERIAADGTVRWASSTLGSTAERIGLNTEPSTGRSVPSFRDETDAVDGVVRKDGVRWLRGGVDTGAEEFPLNTEPSTGYPTDSAMFRGKANVPSHLDWKNAQNEGALTWEDGVLRAAPPNSASDDEPNSSSAQGSGQGEDLHRDEWKRAGKTQDDPAPLLGEPSVGLDTMRGAREIRRMRASEDWRSAAPSRADASEGLNTEPSQGYKGDLPPREYDVDRDAGTGWKRTGVVSSPTEQFPLDTEPSRGIDSMHGIRPFEAMEPWMDWKRAGNAHASENRDDRAVVGGLGPSSEEARDGDGEPRWAVVGTKSTAETIPPNTEPSTGMDATRDARSLAPVPAHLDWKRAGRDAALADDDHLLYDGTAGSGGGGGGPDSSAGSDSVRWATAGTKSTAETIPLNTEPSTGLDASRGARSLEPLPPHLDWKRAGGDSTLADDDNDLIVSHGMRGNVDTGAHGAFPEVGWNSAALVKHDPAPLNTEPTPRDAVAREDGDRPRWVASRGSIPGQR